jgi:ornithine carbamoyltransferase
MTGHRPFMGKSMGMIFQKRSTRTRMSAEVAWNMLGGHAVFLGSNDIHLGLEESVGDTARVLSHMNDCLLARVYGHRDVIEMAEAATIPVINALSNSHHPLQALADYMILQETFKVRSKEVRSRLL